jgi:hypothetical protein
LTLEARPGWTATLSQRGEDGKTAGPPALSVVADAQETRHRANAIARALGLKFGLRFIETSRDRAS